MAVVAILPWIKKLASLPPQPGNFTALSSAELAAVAKLLIKPQIM
jgi:hypothetical protein